LSRGHVFIRTGLSSGVIRNVPVLIPVPSSESQLLFPSNQIEEIEEYKYMDLGFHFDLKYYLMASDGDPITETGLAQYVTASV
jgi:hypothetical protein